MLEPNTKYGYDKEIILCLRGVTGFPMLYLKCEPFDVNLIGAKISTDENGNATLEGWDKVEFLNEDGTVREESRPYISGFNKFIDDKPVIYEICFPDEEV